MKNQIIEKISKLFLAFAIATILIGSVFAFPGKQLAFANIEAVTKNKQFRADANNEQITLKNSAVETGSVSEINQINFLVAHCLIRIGYEGYFDEHKKNNYATVSKNLKILIQLLGRQSEAATLAAAFIIG